MSYWRHNVEPFGARTPVALSASAFMNAAAIERPPWGCIRPAESQVCGVAGLISFVANAAAGGIQNAALTITFAAGDAADDLALLFVISKYPPAAPTAPSTPVFTSVGQVTGGAGGPAADSGQVTLSIFQRTIDGTEPAVTVNAFGANSVMGVLPVHRSNLGDLWEVEIVTTAQNTPAQSWSVEINDLDFRPGDLAIVAAAINSDSTFGPPVSSAGLSIPGCTISAQTTLANGGQGTGDDIGRVIFSHTITAGVSAGLGPDLVTMSFANPPGAAAPAGCVALLRVRSRGRA